MYGDQFGEFKGLIGHGARVSLFVESKFQFSFLLSKLCFSLKTIPVISFYREGNPQ